MEHALLIFLMTISLVTNYKQILQDTIDYMKIHV